MSSRILLFASTIYGICSFSKTGMKESTSLLLRTNTAISCPGTVFKSSFIFFATKYVSEFDFVKKQEDYLKVLEAIKVKIDGSVVR